MSTGVLKLTREELENLSTKRLMNINRMLFGMDAWELCIEDHFGEHWRDDVDDVQRQREIVKEILNTREHIPKNKKRVVRKKNRNSPNPVGIRKGTLEKTPTHVLVGYQKILMKSIGKGDNRRMVWEACRWGGWGGIANYKPLADKYKEIEEILNEREEKSV